MGDSLIARSQAVRERERERERKRLVVYSRKLLGIKGEWKIPWKPKLIPPNKKVVLNDMTIKSHP